MKRPSAKLPRLFGGNRTYWNKCHKQCWLPLCISTPPIDTHEMVGGAHRSFTVKDGRFWVRLCRKHHDCVHGCSKRKILPILLALKRWHDLYYYEPEVVIRKQWPNCQRRFQRELIRTADTYYARLEEGTFTAEDFDAWYEQERHKKPSRGKPFGNP